MAMPYHGKVKQTYTPDVENDDGGDAFLLGFD
jgi:hypothetical protein